MVFIRNDDIVCVVTLVGILCVVDVLPHPLHLLPLLSGVLYAVGPFLPLKNNICTFVTRCLVLLYVPTSAAHVAWSSRNASPPLAQLLSPTSSNSPLSQLIKVATVTQLSLDLRRSLRNMRQYVAYDKWSVHRLVYEPERQHALEYSTEESIFLLVQSWICNFIGRHNAQPIWRNKRTVKRNVPSLGDAILAHTFYNAKPKNNFLNSLFS
jgi:hypothetical protein